MKKTGAYFFAIPCAANNSAVVGGQVTAARSLLQFLGERKESYFLVDTASFLSSNSRFIRFYSRLKAFLLSLRCAIFGRFKSALFFKSSISGLCARFFPAVIFRFRGARVAIFFRNSEMLTVTPRSFSAFLSRFLLSPYTVFFVQGEFLKIHLVKIGFSEDQIVVIPNWRPLGFEAYQKANDRGTRQLRFVFTGRMVKDKGVFEILEAMQDLNLVGRCSCVFAGDGPDLYSCKDLAVQRKIANVQFLGGVAREEVKDLLMESDVLLLPTHHPEGFPNSILEAMSLGLPVIATNVGAITESVRDGVNGFIVPCQSPKALISAMLNYVDRPSLVEEQSLNTLEVVANRHDRERNCEMLLKYLD